MSTTMEQVVTQLQQELFVLRTQVASQVQVAAWESTNWEDLSDNPLHTVIAETELTDKFIEDEEGTDLLLPRMWVEKPMEIEHRKLCILFAGTQAHGHIGSCPGYALLTLHGKETKPRKDEFRGCAYGTRE